MYDRRSSFERRANMHYESAEEDAAYIAGEVILGFNRPALQAALEKNNLLQQA